MKDSSEKKKFEFPQSTAAARWKKYREGLKVNVHGQYKDWLIETAKSEIKHRGKQEPCSRSITPRNCQPLGPLYLNQFPSSSALSSNVKPKSFKVSNQN